MECNKDEATRAKSIAEGKLEQNDYSCAKKFALKAQSLYPGLDGISQMLTTLEVYASAENKIRGEVDWYCVLNVNPSADDETIKRQYKKLALMVHPDKNTSSGADGAFKLVSEAWRFLSDKTKRLEYNKRRGYEVFQQNVQTHQSAPSRPSQPNVWTHTGGPSAPSRQSEQKVPQHNGGPSRPSRPSQKKVPRHTGDPSAQSTQSQQKVPRPTGEPSAPSVQSQQKARRHTGATSALSRPSSCHSGVPSSPSRPSQHKAPDPSAPSNCASRETPAPKPQDRSSKASKKRNPPSQPTIDTFWTIDGASAPSRPSQPKVSRHTGGPLAPSTQSQKKVSRHTGGPSAPSTQNQQKVPRHSGGRLNPAYTGVPSAPSRSNQHEEGPSAPFNFASRETAAPQHLDRSAKASRKRTPGPSQQTIDTFWTIGGPSAQSGTSQQKVPRHTGGPSAPSRPNQQKVPRHTGGPSAPSRPSPAHTVVPPAQSMPSQHKDPDPLAPKPQDRSANASRKRTPAPSHQIIDTFWTTCHHCSAQHEHLKIFRNCTLLCQKCRKPFMASETVHQPNL